MKYKIRSLCLVLVSFLMLISSTIGIKAMDTLTDEENGNVSYHFDSEKGEVKGDFKGKTVADVISNWDDADGITVLIYDGDNLVKNDSLITSGMILEVSDSVETIRYTIIDNKPTVSKFNTATVLISGGSWMQGMGVNVYSNHGDYVNTFYQCVELITRLYRERGWDNIGTLASMNHGARSMIESAESKPGSFEVYRQGSSYVPVPGDVIVEHGTASNPYGHVSVVNYIEGNTIQAVEQNAPATSGGRVYYIRNDNFISRYGNGVSIKGIIHAKKNPLSSGGGNVPGKKSGIIPQRPKLMSNKTGTGKMADVNGDGRMDYVMPFTGDNGLLSLATYLGQPNGEFSSQPITTNNVNYGFVTDNNGQGTGMLADTNGDGLADYVMPFRGGGSLLRIATYLGQPNGGFNSQPITTMNTNYGYEIDANGQVTGIIGDVNGDGRADYVMPFTGGNGLLSLATYLGQPGGGFSAQPITTSNSNYGVCKR